MLLLGLPLTLILGTCGIVQCTIAMPLSILELSFIPAPTSTLPLSQACGDNISYLTVEHVMKAVQGCGKCTCSYCCAVLLELVLQSRSLAWVDQHCPQHG